MATKTETAVAASGRFFEDFRLDQEFRHAIPRTVTAGDVALYTALTGCRFAINAAAPFARACGLSDAPVDDLLVFHLVFGRTVPDISLNAVGNLGYAQARFGAFVYPGDTLHAVSTVIGLREITNRRAGILWVRTHGFNQRGESVVDYVRWVMVAKRTSLAPIAPPPETVVPKLAEAVAAKELSLPKGLDLAGYDTALSGGPQRWGDYAVGDRIDHVAGVTVEDAEHQLAARLYNNPARVHFDRRRSAATAFGRRLVYGGHVMSLARAQSFEGFPNAFRIAAINGGRHVAPVGGGDTLYAWTEVRERLELPGRSDVGALRLRTLAFREHECGEFPDKTIDGKDHPALVLDLDYTVLLPK